MADQDTNVPYGPVFKANPFPTLAAMRRDAPVCQILGMDGDRKIWYVTRYADVEAVLRDHQRFANNYQTACTPAERANLPPLSRFQKIFTETMLNLDGADHARLRSLVSKAFTPRLVQRWRPQIQAMADALLDQVQAQGAMDLIAAYARPLPMQVILSILGIPSEDHTQVYHWSSALFDPASADEEQAGLEKFFDYLDSLFAAKRLHPQEDLLSALVQAEESGDKLSKDELYAMVALLIIAGYETTVKLIGNGILALLQHPEQLELLRQNPALIENAIEELLRYYSPFDRAKMRYAAEDLLFGGQLIRRGEPLSVLLLGANHDERSFHQAETLDITRERCPHLAFGAGIHVCLGAALARLEGAIAINTLLQRLPGLQLAVPLAQVEWDQNSIVFGVKRLPVQWSAER